MDNLDPETKVSLFDKYVLGDPAVTRKIEQALHKDQPNLYMPTAELRDELEALKTENAKLKESIEQKVSRLESDRIAAQALEDARKQNGASSEEWAALPKFMEENHVQDPGKALEFMRLSAVKAKDAPDPNRGRMQFTQSMIDQITGKTDRRTARRRNLLSALDEIRQGQARSEFLATR